jgi:type I restriction enzyme R subunit
MPLPSAVKTWGLTDDEIAFYDALAANESARQVMGRTRSWKVIATELISQVRKSVTIDWTCAKALGAKIRVVVKAHPETGFGYPPDLHEEAEENVCDAGGVALCGCGLREGLLLGFARLN